jgi:hypothetical protein
MYYSLFSCGQRPRVVWRLSRPLVRRFRSGETLEKLSRIRTVTISTGQLPATKPETQTRNAEGTRFGNNREVDNPGNLAVRQSYKRVVQKTLGNRSYGP